MAKAYICPLCGARNRFDASQSKDGVVRCGACHKPFMLPDYSKGVPRPGSNQPPIGKKGSTVRARPAPDPDPDPDPATDTAVVDTRYDLSRPPQRIAGSAEATLLVYDEPPTRKPSETPTIMSFDALDVPIAGARPERATRIDAPAIATDSVGDDTMVEELRVPVLREPPRTIAEPEVNNAATVPLGDVPPASLLDELPPRASATTQPTDPPPEYVARLKEKPPEPSQAGTQPAAVGRDPLNVIALVASALALAAVVGGGFYFADGRVEGALEQRLVQGSADASMKRAANAVHAISETMAAGRPDLSREVASGLGDDLQILRADGSRAFSGDWATYRDALTRVCGGANVPRAQARVIAAWRAGADPRIAGLGGDPCEALATLPSVARPADKVLADRLSESPEGSGRAWVEESGSERIQVVVHPIEAGKSCAGCHAAGDKVLGYAVVRTSLSSLDEGLSETRSTLMWTGIAASILAGLALLVLVWLNGREGRIFVS
ncbi:MAG: hypothetical protein ACI9WU_001422 [Myxococcota bacterium]|jgi:hypothetical protein